MSMSLARMIDVNNSYIDVFFVKYVITHKHSGSRPNDYSMCVLYASDVGVTLESWGNSFCINLLKKYKY